MIKLIIDQAGYSIDINGRSISTPAVIDISRISMNLVRSKLISQGITKFRIESDSDVPKKKVKNVKIDNTQLLNKIDQSQLPENIDRFELLLEKLEKFISSKDKSDGVSIIDKKKKEEEDEKFEFIPDISSDSLSLKGNVGTTVVKRDDVTESVESLTGFKKGNKL